MASRAYAGCGAFENEWANPPPPFNPDFDPKAKARFEAVTASMEADDYYASHSREECATEWQRRYAERRDADQAQAS